jgi:hypothetical protein
LALLSLPARQTSQRRLRSPPPIPLVERKAAPMSVSIDRLVRNQVIFREVNERIREVAEHFNFDDSGIDFICECSVDGCSESIELEVDEYKAIRSSPTLFVIVPGHETLKVEVVIETNDRYMLVEKIRKVDLVTESHVPIIDGRE